MPTPSAKAALTSNTGHRRSRTVATLPPATPTRASGLGVRMRWLRRWIRRHDHWGGLHGCQVLLAAVVPQPDLDVIWWPQLVLLAGQVGELRGRQTVALVPVLLGGGAHRHERGLQRPHRQGRLVLVRDGRGLAPDDRGKDTTGDLFQLAHPAVVAGRADRLDRCLERPAGLAVLTRPVQPP